MKKVDVKFLPGDVVLIKEIDCKGTVVQINIALECVSYKVMYWFNAKREECWLYDYEIKSE